MISGPAGQHTIDAQQALLKAVEQYGSYAQAADAIGISRTTVYNWIEADKALGVDEESPVGSSFLSALVRAKRIAAETMLGTSYQQALETKGMPGTIERIFHIKRWYPEYRDQLNIKHSGSVLQGRVDLNQLDPTERRELLGLLSRRLQLADGTGQENVASGDEAGE